MVMTLLRLPSGVLGSIDMLTKTQSFNNKGIKKLHCATSPLDRFSGMWTAVLQIIVFTFSGNQEDY